MRGQFLVLPVTALRAAYEHMFQPDSARAPPMLGSEILAEPRRGGPSVARTEGVVRGDLSLRDLLSSFRLELATLQLYCDCCKTELYSQKPGCTHIYLSPVVL